jgi:hypothetical protein
MSDRSAASVLCCAAALAGCGGASLSPGATCDGGPACAFMCSPAVDAPPIEGNTHVAEGSTITYKANPPSSGNHYPIWQEPYAVYPNASHPDLVQRGYWVHNLEHGAIVLLYNCPSGCDADVQALTALRNGTPPDRFNTVRVLVTPDPLVPHRFAALAWGWRWQGDAVDADAIRCFIGARYDRAPESTP